MLAVFWATFLLLFHASDDPEEDMLLPTSGHGLSALSSGLWPGRISPLDRLLAGDGLTSRKGLRGLHLRNWEWCRFSVAPLHSAIPAWGKESFVAGCPKEPEVKEKPPAAHWQLVQKKEERLESLLLPCGRAVLGGMLKQP